MLPKNFKESLICIEKACYQAGLSFKYLFDTDFIAEVDYPDGRKLHFLHNKNPFNSYISARICSDKDLQQKFYAKNNIPHPKTKSYFNPTSPSHFQKYSNFTDISEIHSDIIQNFDFPFLFKKNQSSLSKDVFLVQKPDQLTELLTRYFPPKKFEIILIQKYIPGTEYRVIAWKGEPLLAYTKKQKFTSTKSSQAPQKVDPSQFQAICQKIHQTLQVDFCGIDIIQSDSNQIVLETNSNPACFYYNKYHGREDFTQVYLKCLQEYQN